MSCATDLVVGMDVALGPSFSLRVGVSDRIITAVRLASMQIPAERSWIPGTGGAQKIRLISNEL